MSWRGEGVDMVCKLLSANAFGTRPGPQAPATLLLAPRHRIIKIRKQGVVVPGYDTVDGAGLGAFAGMLPADQCAQRAMGAFKVTRAPSRSRRDSRCHQRVAPRCWLERVQAKKKAWL